LYFVLDGSGYNGFIVSNRKGAQTLAEKQTFDKEDKWRTSGDDIFSVTFPKEVLADLDVRVFDQNDKPVKGATITLREVSKKEGQTQTNPRGNKFNFPLELDKQYEIVAASECYNGDKVVISTKDLKESKTFVTEFVLKMVAPTITKRTIKKTKTFSKGQPIVLKNLNFDFNSDVIRGDAEPILGEMLKLMQKYPEMKIDLSSHTDAQGTDTYNQRLSQRRADSSKKWLVERGIAPERIRAIGKGESELLNHCANGVKCDDKEHEVNRRTDFRITEGPTEITTDLSEDEMVEVFDTIPCKPKVETGALNDGKTTSIAFNKEIHDFGKVKKGTTVEYVFVLTNTGKEKLVIEHASGSCGCTVPTFPKEAIAPGGKGEIKVVYTAKEDKEIGLEDEQEVTIIANTEPPVYTVQIKAKVVE
jgi:outer membrane protein OmpA-like peptidoglycan-associated protein